MIVVKTELPVIACSFSFFWYKRVMTGPGFERLPAFQRIAAIQHEIGHCEGHHTEQRLLCLIFAPFMLKWLCHRHEFEADRFAAKRGFRDQMLKILSKDVQGTFFHPSHEARRKKLALQA